MMKLGCFCLPKFKKPIARKYQKKAGWGGDSTLDMILMVDF
jgi:hypothetical protein